MKFFNVHFIFHLPNTVIGIRSEFYNKVIVLGFDPKEKRMWAQIRLDERVEVTRTDLTTYDPY